VCLIWSPSRASSSQPGILYILNDADGDEGIPKVTITTRSELLADLLRSELIESTSSELDLQMCSFSDRRKMNMRSCKDRIDGLRIQSPMHLVKARLRYPLAREKQC